ncbi:Acg family FMN-binding oxidoreductase [Geodermatophilus ruber]|uniref:Nitroreductase family protein n=1 Tax=Geodermatophilus ruber TaxID=504800 RepID=A0A1I4HPE3_9ACTN|nr:hypothetical protein [Geodermatophilus ruber]SFL43266.1 hypothetical protein SAMN04488085_11133 [Geodermatophilus ruber]
MSQPPGSPSSPPGDPTGAEPGAPPAAGPDAVAVAARWEAMEDAVDRALLAPSVHNTQPWLLVLHPEGIEVRADRTRQLTALDPLGRELVMSLGAAVFDLRIALAARDFAVEVDRSPRRADPDLLAVVRPVPGPADTALGDLEPLIDRRRASRRGRTCGPLPGDVLARLTEVSARADVELVPVRRAHHRRLVARLADEAGRILHDDPVVRAEVRHWTTRSRPADDGVLTAAVAHDSGRPLPCDPVTGPGQTIVLLTTTSDDPQAWLRVGEALEHVLLELTARGWVASPVPQALEIPLTRMQLRSALAWAAHPQLLLLIGHAEPTAPASRRRREDVVRNSNRPAAPPTGPPPCPPSPPPPRHRLLEPVHSHPVSDGRGGTTWL